MQQLTGCLLSQVLGKRALKVQLSQRVLTLGYRGQGRANTRHGVELPAVFCGSSPLLCSCAPRDHLRFACTSARLNETQRQETVVSLNPQECSLACLAALSGPLGSGIKPVFWQQCFSRNYGRSETTQGTPHL